MQIMALIYEMGRCLRAMDHGMSGLPVFNTSWEWSQCPPFAFAQEVKRCGGALQAIDPALEGIL